MLFANFYMARPSDRPLSATDRYYCLKQRERLDCVPDGSNGVIVLGDEYLEIVDHAYPYKGAIAFEWLSFTIGMSAIVYAMWWFSAERTSGVVPGEDMLISFSFVMLVLAPVYLWLMSKEFFVQTHYPIRFDRATRSISVLRRDKTVLRVPWDDVFFTCGHILELEWWEIRGYVLDWDEETILETFVLSCSGDVYRSKEPYAGMALPSPAHDPLLRRWELVRRYMEEGRQAIEPFVERTIPANIRRETFGESLEYCLRRHEHPVVRRLLSPLSAVRAVFRWLALRSCKIPQWSA